MASTLLRCVALLCALCSARAFVLTPLRLPGGAAAPSAQPPLPAPSTLAPPALLHPSRAPPVQMGLFGLGTPELVVIAGVALLILGPEQVKKLAKDVGKVSAELKQVPEEFSKGLEVGALESEKKKMKEPEQQAEAPPAKDDAADKKA
ncbi:hypothetical protein AB1Y20_010204 [Prymnesium parvum]|uniref:Sec-independent protein translocase protein TatA n=1 Tax=Prymnesium parvum TaxID=97485 RepID=A0AB34K7A9_PRYPA